MRVFSIIYLFTVPESLTRLVRSKLNNDEPIVPNLLSLTQWKSLIVQASPSRWLDRIVADGAETSNYFRFNVIILLAINVIIYGGAMGTAEVLVMYPQV